MHGTLKHILPFIVALLAVWLASCSPQTAAPVVVEPSEPIILNETGGHFPVSRFDVFPDPTNQLTVDNVVSGEAAGEFRPAAGPNFAHTADSIWLRFTVQNESDAINQWMLEVDRSDVDSLTFFRPDGSGGYASVETGSALPFDTREVEDSRFVFPIEQPPGTSATYYLRARSDVQLSLPVTIWEESAFHASRHAVALLWGIVYGAILIMAGHYFVLFLSLRRPTYLLLVIYALSVLLLTADLQGDTAQYLWPNTGSLTVIVAKLATPIAAISLLLLTSYFLDLPRRSPRYYQWVKALVIAFVAGGILTFVAGSWATTLITLLFLIAMVTALAAAVSSWRHGYRPAMILSLALAMPLLTGLFVALNRLGIGQTSPVVPIIPAAGTALMLMLMGLALADQIRLAEEDVVAANRTLDRERHWYQTILDDQIDIVARMEPDGRLSYVNRAYAEYFGRPREELIGSYASDLMDPSALAEVRTSLATLSPDNPVVVYEAPVKDGQGRERWQRWSVHAIYHDDGQIHELQGTGRDVTEQRTASAELEAERRRFRQVLNALPDVVLRHTPDMSLTFVNEAACRFFGRDEQSLIGEDIRTLLNPNAVELGMAQQPALTPDLPSATTVMPATNASGEVRWWRTTMQGLFDASGQVEEIQVTSQDISDQHAAAELLAHERATYQRILDDQLDMIARVGPDGTLRFVNQAYCDFFGGKREELIGRSMYSVVLPEAQTLVHDIFASITPTNPVVVSEGPTANADGQARWTRWTQRGFFDASGNIVEYQASGHDVTAQREAQEELDRYRNRLEELVALRTNELKDANKNLMLQREISDSLQQSTMALNRALDLPVLLYLLLSQLGRVSRHDGASIWLIEGNELVLKEAVDVSRDYLGRRLPLTDLHEPTVAAMHETRGKVISDCTTSPEWAQWPDGEPIGSWVGLPLKMGDEPIGVLCVDRLDPLAYSESDLDLLRPFADQAAVAIFNARLIKQARADAAVEERERLARDLHDAVTQTLFSASIMAEAVPLQLQMDPEAGLVSLKKLQQLTRGALGEMRTLLLELRPATLIHSNLGTLLGYLGDAATARSRIPVSVSVNDPDLRLPPDVQIAFYRIAQEALNNITKHAAPTQAHLELVNRPDAVMMTIRDNGRGFERDRVSRGQLGLSIMQERARAIGASLEVESEAGVGTTLQLCWPWKAGSHH